MSEDFCHLHVHTHYSLLDGINRPDQLAKYVADQKMTACAISDHGVLSGIIDFYKECKKVGVKPLLGVEAYLTEDEDGIEDNTYKTKDNYHCILIAQNLIGLKNLFWMTNQANFHNFYYRPRISIKHLENGRAEGLVATSSCLGGIVAKKGLFDKSNKTFRDEPNGKTSLKINEARNNLNRLYDIFGGNFYAEIQDNPEHWEQEAYNRWLIKEAKDSKIPLVITSDAHWLTKEDKSTHDLIMAQQLGLSVEDYIKQGDEDGLYYGKGHYIRSPEEMYEAALKYNSEEAFYNTIKIKDSCEVDIKLGDYQTPKFDIKQENDYEDFRKWRATQNECSRVIHK